MTLSSVVVVALATWQAVEIWRHSALFANWRSITEMWDNKVGELLSCPWCLSVWVGIAFCLLLHFSEVWLIGISSQIVIYGLAASRLANLGNDYFKSCCRTPNQVGLLSQHDEDKDTTG